MDKENLVQLVFTRDLDAVKSLLASHEDPEQLLADLDAEKRSVIHAAAFVGDPDILEYLVSKCPKSLINGKDNKWVTPLHRACQANQSEATAVLLRYGADSNARDKNWQTAAHIAAANGSLECLRILLDPPPALIDSEPVSKLSNVNMADRSGRSCLHLAAYHGHEAVCKLLMEGGALVDQGDKRDRRPIHWAAFRRQRSVAKLLIQRGCDLEARDKDGFTPLHAAAAASDLSDVNHWKGDEENEYDPVKSSTMINILVGAGADMSATTNLGNTALHIACLNENTNALPLLIRLSEELEYDEGDVGTCTIESVNNNKETPMHLAAIFRDKMDTLEASTEQTCLEMLLKEDKNIQLLESSSKSIPLHFAAKHGCIRRIKALVEAGSPINALDAQGRTPLHLAALNGHHLAFPHLLAAGADLTLKDVDGRTPLHLSAKAASLHSCSKLVVASTGASYINDRDNENMTCLHLCAFKGPPRIFRRRCRRRSGSGSDQVGDTLPESSNAKCLEFLIEVGADPNMRDCYGRLPLHYAAARCWHKCVNVLIKCSHIDSQDHQGCSPLHFACSEDLDGRCLDVLLRHSANPLLKDACGRTALHYASSSGNLTAVIRLTENRSLYEDECSSEFDAFISLHHAAAGGNEETVAALLSVFYHQINCYDVKSGCTPLHIAAYNGHLLVLQMLLRHGAQVCIQDQGASRRTPVHYAAMKGHGDCVRFLLDNTEDESVVRSRSKAGWTPLMEAAAKGHSTVIEMLVEYGCSIDAQDLLGRTALYLAAANGHEDFVQALLRKEADVAVADTLGKNPLHAVAIAGHVGIMGLLVDQVETICSKTGAQSVGSRICSMVDKQGFAPLHWASYFGNEGCVEILLLKIESPSHLLSQSSAKFTPVHCAASRDHYKCLSLLLTKFKSSSSILETRDNLDRTPLHVAALTNSMESIKVLVDHDVDINAMDKFGRTPLILAVMKSNVSIVEYLVSKNCELGSKDAKGNTALHYGCMKEPDNSFAGEAIAKVLLKAPNAQSLDINHQNNKGQAPLHLAAPRGFMDTTETLLSMGASVYLTDNKGLSPALACAPNDDVATCLSLIMEVFFASSAPGPVARDTKLSLSPFGSTRLSDVSFKMPGSNCKQNHHQNRSVSPYVASDTTYLVGNCESSSATSPGSKNGSVFDQQDSNNHHLHLRVDEDDTGCDNFNRGSNCNGSSTSAC